MAMFGLIVAVASLIAPPGGEAKPAKTLPPPKSGTVDFKNDVKPILARCEKCHGAAKQQGGLRLDLRDAALAGGDRGVAIVVGKSADSALIRAVAGLDPDLEMPPAGKAKLSAAEIGVLRAWIDGGANYDAAIPAAAAAVKRESKHWSFQPVAAVKPPALAKYERDVRNPIDRFVLARLEKEEIAPSPPADRATQLRRLSLDLVGLPPTPEEVDAFLADASADAYEKIVDRLLASPHYGERWARHWLDLARYADSDGYEKDTGRPFAWRYRDWTIRALNEDMSFDRFTIEQLAGDLLAGATIEQKTATGFHRNTLTNKEGGVDAEEYRVAAVLDRVNTTGQTWLGLTVGCCQCHDHKYDPLAQREYYRLFAFFNSDREADLPAPLPGEKERIAAQKAKFDAEVEKLQIRVEEAKKKNLPAAERKKREKAVADYKKKGLPKPSEVQTLAAGPARKTHVLVRGDFLRPGAEVKAGTPAVLPKLAATKGEATRLELARWLVSAENPLTPRVIANWVWQRHFGRGLVATPEDFGTQGSAPSHPELLDWLANEFRSAAGCGWSLKKLHRLIVTSGTYRQSARLRPELAERDPRNVLLARQARIRVEAEIVRDGALAAAGLLDRSIGGPSIRPPQPPGISELTYANSVKWTETKGKERYKRGMYVWFQRTSPFPMLMAFDEPDSNVCAARRERSNTPLQALTLLNDAVFVEAAQALAAAAQEECKGKDAAAVATRMFRRCLGRAPAEQEIAKLAALFREAERLAGADPAATKKMIGATAPKET
ncbi:MAG TPA: PSD1 and planctomycete cytochrome C domain-containing protein, partial [Planctomycetia bacterium]|nr:PSD1 and planctomycete cytochrome C domain-containing protein [Planctomycetia bacterium]